LFQQEAPVSGVPARDAVDLDVRGLTVDEEALVAQLLAVDDHARRLGPDHVDRAGETAARSAEIDLLAVDAGPDQRHASAVAVPARIVCRLGDRAPGGFPGATILPAPAFVRRVDVDDLGGAGQRWCPEDRERGGLC